MRLGKGAGIGPETGALRRSERVCEGAPPLMCVPLEASLASVMPPITEVRQTRVGEHVIYVLSIK